MKSISDTTMKFEEMFSQLLDAIQSVLFGLPLANFNKAILTFHECHWTNGTQPKTDSVRLTSCEYMFNVYSKLKYTIQTKLKESMTTAQATGVRTVITASHNTIWRIKEEKKKSNFFAVDFLQLFSWNSIEKQQTSCSLDGLGWHLLGRQCLVVYNSFQAIDFDWAIAPLLLEQRHD